MGRCCSQGDPDQRNDDGCPVDRQPYGVGQRSSHPIDAKDAKVLPFIEGGKTYMPVNFVASSLGAAVSYDRTTKVVTLTLKEG